MNRKNLEQKTQSYCAEMNDLPPNPFFDLLKVQSALIWFNTLEQIVHEMDLDPFPSLNSVVDSQLPFIGAASRLKPILTVSEEHAASSLTAEQNTKRLFEQAWTVYDEKTYRHSVDLIRNRLLANGFDDRFFRGKKCLDGGCGTGRFAVAMAEMGAQVVAIDIGEQSLDFARGMTKRLKVSNVEFLTADTTDLKRWRDEAFDFVVSNGVLHHAEQTERGIREHFRVTKKGGIFWLYLYGKGGIYWQMYDHLKGIVSSLEVTEVRRVLTQLGCRQGAIYSFLDNVLAPIRKYYSLPDVHDALAGGGSYQASNLKGTSTIDDTDKVLATAFGRDIYGPDGEIRLRIQRA